MNYMGQSPSQEAYRCSAGKEILILLWNPTVHYSVHVQRTTELYPEAHKCTLNPQTT